MINCNVMYVLRLDMEPLYDLCAVLIHHGPSASSGHYIAVIKDPVSGNTYKFNDTEVEKEKKFSIVNEEDTGNNNNNNDTYIAQIHRCRRCANACQRQTEMFSVCS